MLFHVALFITHYKSQRRCHAYTSIKTNHKALIA